MRHRMGLVATGLAAIGLGATGLVFGLGDRRGEPVLTPAMTRFAARQAGFWPVAGLLCWLVAVFGLVWLIAQVRTTLARHLALVDGTTRMLTRAAARGLTGDIRGLPGVQDVTVRFTGAGPEHCVQLLVVCDEQADLAALRTRIADGPIARFRHLVDMPDLPAVVRFRLTYRKRCLA